VNGLGYLSLAVHGSVSVIRDPGPGIGVLLGSRGHELATGVLFRLKMHFSAYHFLSKAGLPTVPIACSTSCELSSAPVPESVTINARDDGKPSQNSNPIHEPSQNPSH